MVPLYKHIRLRRGVDTEADAVQTANPLWLRKRKKSCFFYIYSNALLLLLFEFPRKINV
jgi:hypothetical protein